MVLARAGQSRLQEPVIPDSRSAAVESKEPIVDSENFAFVNPDWLFFLHLERARSVLR